MAPKRYQTVLAVAFWVIVWQLGAMAANRSLLLPLPTPIDTLAALGRLGTRGAFYLTVGASLLRITAGFLAALVVGTAGAVLCAAVPLLGALMAPLLALLRAIPVASFTILVFLWVSRGSVPSVISFFTVLPIVWANVESGLHHCDRKLTEMARVFGMRGGEVLRHVTLPALRPFFTVAVGSGLGFAWKSGVAAEVICRPQSSLGNLLWAGNTAVNYDEVFALTLIIVVLSLALQFVARRALERGVGRG